MKRSDGELLDRAAKAKAILENPIYDESWTMCREAIITLMEKTPLSNRETAENLRRCLKLLKDVRANLELVMNQGRVVAFTLKQAAERKANPRKGLFR